MEVGARRRSVGPTSHARPLAFPRLSTRAWPPWATASGRTCASPGSNPTSLRGLPAWTPPRSWSRRAEG
eukprot:14707256-Alexandrium_andersonii.AAC.1